MKKITPPKSVTHPISAKIIAGLRKTTGRKVVDIAELRDAKITAENLDKTVITEKQLSRLDPLHGVYRLLAVLCGLATRNSEEPQYFFNRAS